MARGDILFNNRSTADEFVSREWYPVLIEARRRGWDGDVSEGRRDLARQRFFFNCMQCCCCNNCNTAAFPSPFAPHIRVGRGDHAIDVTEPDELIRILENMGLDVHRPVAGEDWHVEAVSASQLRRVAAKYSDRTGAVIEPLPAHIERHVKKFLTSKRAVILEAQAGGCGKKCRAKKEFRQHMRGVVRSDLQDAERNGQSARKANDRIRARRTARILKRVLADTDGVLTPGKKGGN
jgi:hypothetical protein